MLRDDTCKTSSLKCKKNNVAYKNTSLSLGLYDKETKIRIARRKYNYNPFSRLALYGYSVGKNGLNDEGRKQILIYIIEHQVMTKSKIISHLQGLISLRENRTDADFTSAISKWKKDIVFVNGYRTKK